MMATNLQDEPFQDGIEEVFHRSTLDWLDQEDLVAIYNRHHAMPLPLSHVRLGPQPLEEGIFVYRSRRFRDYFEWDDVDQVRRRNCRSGAHVAGAEVTHTEASLVRPEGDVFWRRNHHRGENQFCIVHYLIRPAEDDGGVGDGGVDDEDEDGGVDDEAEDGGVADEAEDGGVADEAEDGGDEDSDSDDFNGDPDYDPELDESEQMNLSSSDVDLAQLDRSAHSLGYLEALTRGPVAKGKCYGVLLLIARFINSCDAGQIRLAKEKYVSLCKRFKDMVLELNDPVRGVAPLVSAVNKVHVSAKCLTALRPDCLQLCLQAKCCQAGFFILSDDILEVGQPRDFYLFCYYGGSICIGRLKRFQKASELLYNSYYEVGNRYNDGKISELEAVVVAQSSDLETDKDLGLVKQVVASFYKQNILSLTQKYLALSLQDIANTVQLANAKEAEIHVLQMIQEGQIHALINQKDGTVRFLEDPEQYKTSEMIDVMDSVIQRTIGLSKTLLAMDESLSCDPLYLGKPYYEVGNRYNDGKISELEAVVVAQSSDLEKDKDLGLVKQAVSSLYKRNILGLTEKYLTSSLQDIVNKVQTANAKEAEMHVLKMIQDGQIHALINQKARFLEDPEQYKTSEMIDVMDSVIQRTIGLSKTLLAMDESLSCDPLHLGKVGRERQRYDFGDEFDTAPQKFSM